MFLDLATRTGWSALARTGDFSTGVQEWNARTGETNGIRFERFRGWLRMKLDSLGFVAGDVVAYEEPIVHGRGSDQIRRALGFVSMLELEATDRKLELLPVPNTTLKKHATGRGDALKPDMIRAAIARWGWDQSWQLVAVRDFDKKYRAGLEVLARRGRVPDDNQVDAVWGLNFTLAKLGLTPNDFGIDAAVTVRASDLDTFFDGTDTPCAGCGKPVPRLSGYCFWAHAPGDRSKWIFKHIPCLYRKRRRAKPVKGTRDETKEAVAALVAASPAPIEETPSAPARAPRPRRARPEDPAQLRLFGPPSTDASSPTLHGNTTTTA